ncbi:hypothetical protein Q9Q94_09170 [Uliginosibacterium sp. 31-16]|uniref:hypothetical protein n=1 Tax=Uliginosibacterium sp. 31-16 TaxID=3068315 RepID=UPI00273F15FC|nr:hypothetical protein [Uliginosibacterium sp. 31-16]MDP5239700.1 hypothetical protein [Uliginosibacterium sp. 31-16]
MNANADQTSHPSRSLHIVVAIAAGALLVLLARMATDSLLPPHPVVTAPVPQSVAASQPSSSLTDPQEEDPAVAWARQERLEREKQLIEQNRLRREQKLQEAIASRDQAAEIARLDQERIDQAWTRFYKKPKKCDNASDQSIIVECGNHYIRERQRFDKLWADGKISAR